MTDCELLVIARHSFLPLLERPVITRELLNVLCERLRRSSEQVEDVLFLDLEARIAKTLVRFAEDGGAPQPGAHVAARTRQSCWRVARKSEQTAAGVAAGRNHYHRGGDDLNSRSGRVASN